MNFSIGLAGMTSVYLAFSSMLYNHSITDMLDRAEVLSELVDNANQYIFAQYEMVWTVEKYGMWIECEIKNPRCKAKFTRAFFYLV